MITPIEVLLAFLSVPLVTLAFVVGLTRLFRYLDRRAAARLAKVLANAQAAHITVNKPKIELVCGDITTQQVDVIVNAAKRSLLGGSGVDGAIHRAGGRAIIDECRDLRATRLPTGLAVGHAVATTAGNLPAKYVVHTVGPVYDPARDQSKALHNCYTRSLAAADRLQARTVAFPLISSGVYGWPTDDAIIQALSALETADTMVEEVRLVLFDQATYDLAEELLNA